jgi:hypothetical protein
MIDLLEAFEFLALYQPLSVGHPGVREAMAMEQRHLSSAHFGFRGS